jgi:propionyl-CoA carboxylase beta chain
MGPDGAVNIIFRDQLAKSNGDARAKDKLIEDYRNTFANPYKAAELGYIDEVIEPSQTRRRVIDALESLKNKRDVNPPRKHGNIPL